MLLVGSIRIRLLIGSGDAYLFRCCLIVGEIGLLESAGAFSVAVQRSRCRAILEFEASVPDA